MLKIDKKHYRNKNYVVSARISKELYDLICTVCRETGRNKSEIISFSIEYSLKDLVVKK